MRLRFTPRALRELDEILAYISDRSPSGARRVQSRLQKIFDLLTRHPDAGRQTSDRRLRRMAVAPFPYIVFYRATRADVVVIGVRHSARDPESMPGR